MILYVCDSGAGLLCVQNSLIVGQLKPATPEKLMKTIYPVYFILILFAVLTPERLERGGPC